MLARWVPGRPVSTFLRNPGLDLLDQESDPSGRDLDRFRKLTGPPQAPYRGPAQPRHFCRGARRDNTGLPLPCPFRSCFLEIGRHQIAYLAAGIWQSESLPLTPVESDRARLLAEQERIDLAYRSTSHPLNEFRTEPSGNSTVRNFPAGPHSRTPPNRNESIARENLSRNTHRSREKISQFGLIRKLGRDLRYLLEVERVRSRGSDHQRVAVFAAPRRSVLPSNCEVLF